MKGWISVCLVSLVGCQDGQPQPVTAEVQQDQDFQDCVPGGNFPGATLPATPYFSGQGPQAGAKQIWVVHHDPYKPTETVAYLADYNFNKLVFGTRVTQQNVPWLNAFLGSQPTIRGGEPPPPPPPICATCGGDYYARRDLELGYRVLPAFAFADVAATIPHY